MALGENHRNETKARIHEVMLLILDGNYTHDIVEFCIDPENGYGIKEAQAYEYIRAANLQIEQLHPPEKAEQTLRKVITRLWDLYRKDVAINDYKAAHAVLKTLADLHQPTPAGQIQLLPGAMEAMRALGMEPAEAQALLNEFLIRLAQDEGALDLDDSAPRLLNG